VAIAMLYPNVHATSETQSTSPSLHCCLAAAEACSVADLNETQPCISQLWLLKGGQVSVGRLGVITELDVAIVPQRLLARTVMTEALDDFIASVEAAAAAHAAAVAVRAPAAEVLAALAPLDMTQVQPLPFYGQGGHFARL